MRGRRAASLALFRPHQTNSASRLAWRPISSAPLSSELLTQYTSEIDGVSGGLMRRQRDGKSVRGLTGHVSCCVEAALDEVGASVSRQCEDGGGARPVFRAD